MPHVAPYFSEVNYISPYENTPYSPVRREFGEVLLQKNGNRAHGLTGKQNMHQLKVSFGIPLFNDELWPPSSLDLIVITSGDESNKE